MGKFVQGFGLSGIRFCRAIFQGLRRVTRYCIVRLHMPGRVRDSQASINIGPSTTSEPILSRELEHDATVHTGALGFVLLPAEFPIYERGCLHSTVSANTS